MEAIRKMSMIALQASANVATPSRNIHMRMLSSSIITLTQYQLLRHLSLLQSNTYHYLPSYSTFSVLDDQDDDDVSVVATESGRRAVAQYLVLKWSLGGDHTIVKQSQRYHAVLIGLMRIYDLLPTPPLYGTIL